MQKAEVTVFMAVYNGEKFIHAAIESVLRQTFQDFELLIINDGSTDDSISIVNKYADKRIRLLHNDNNRGLAFTRNRGIEEARGKYFATLDCDDIAYQNRLEKQLAFFSKNKEVAVCGGRVKYIDETSKVVGKLFSLRGDEDFLKSILLFNNIFSNSSTMMDTAILKKFRYDERFAPAEDYDLFERISAEHKIAFINEWLTYYRVHGENSSTLKSERRIVAEKIIAERQLTRYGFSFGDQELFLHTRFTNTDFDFIANHLKEYNAWFSNLIKQNAEKKIFDSQSFGLALSRQWLRILFYKFKTQHSFASVFNKGELTYPGLLKSFINSLY